MKHKKQFLLLAGLGLLVSLHAQEAVTSAGQSAKSGNLIVSWSIGEVMTETYTKQSFTLTQGVQQPRKVEIISSSPEIPGYKISAYPNPTSDYVIVSVAEAAERPLTLKIFDMTGRLLLTTQMADNETRISVANFIAGMYLLQVLDKKNSIQTFKIIKK